MLPGALLAPRFAREHLGRARAGVRMSLTVWWPAGSPPGSAETAWRARV